MAGESKHLARAAEAAFERRGDYESLLFEGRWHRSGELFDRAAAVATGLGAARSRARRTGGGFDAELSRGGGHLSGGVACGPGRDAGDVPAGAGRPSPRARRFSRASRGHDLGVPGQGALRGRRAGTRAVCDLHRLRPTDSGTDGVVSLAELEAAPAGAIVPRADDDLAALLYTGGTTGQAKGVMLSHAALHYVGNAAYTSSHIDGGQSLARRRCRCRTPTGCWSRSQAFMPSSAKSPCCCGGSIRTRSWARSRSIGCSRRRSFRRCCRRCWPSRWRTTTSRRSCRSPRARRRCHLRPSASSPAASRRPRSVRATG